MVTEILCPVTLQTFDMEAQRLETGSVRTPTRVQAHYTNTVYCDCVIRTKKPKGNRGRRQQAAEHFK